MEDWLTALTEGEYKGRILQISQLEVGGQKAIRIDTSHLNRTIIITRFGVRNYGITTTGAEMINNGMLDTLQFFFPLVPVE